MDDSVEDCPVCLNAFDDTERRPRTLPCGHTFCTLCINGLKEQGSVTCPTCNVCHTVPEMGQFPISYITEGLIRRLRELASLTPKLWKQTASPVTQSATKVTTGLSRKAQALLQEQEAKILAAIRYCQEEQSQLADYLTTLNGWRDRQQRLEDELQTLVDQSKSAREMVRHEESRVESRQEEVWQRGQQLQDALQALRTAATRQEVYEVIENADHLVEEESYRTEESLGVFPDVHTVTTVAKVAEASRAALQAAAVTAAAADYSCFPSASTVVSSIAERLKALLTPLSTPAVLAASTMQPDDQPPRRLQAEELLSLTQSARSLVETGHVFAVQEVEEQTRYARISLEDGRLHLYSLQVEAPPSSAVTLQMGEVVPAVPPCEVFLDLVWHGCRAASRVVVSLPRDTARGRQFLLLCSGQLGPCYANTRLSKVEYKGQLGECVQGGNCQTTNASGASLLPYFNFGEYWESERAGAVLLWKGIGESPMFCIATRDCRPGKVWRRIFGEVVKGLEVVKEAAQYRYIQDVTVVQCGVLLSQK